MLRKIGPPLVRKSRPPRARRWQHKGQTIAQSVGATPDRRQLMHSHQSPVNKQAIAPTARTFPEPRERTVSWRPWRSDPVAGHQNVNDAPSLNDPRVTGVSESITGAIAVEDRLGSRRGCVVVGRRELRPGGRVLIVQVQSHGLALLTVAEPVSQAKATESTADASVTSRRAQPGVGPTPENVALVKRDNIDPHGIH